MKENTFKWAPLPIIALCLVVPSAIGGLISFTISEVSDDVSSETPIPYTQIGVTEQSETEHIEIVPEVSIPATSEPEIVELEKVYYDCPLSHDLQDYIRELCEKNGVPMSLVIAMIDVESSFNPSVISGTNDYGLMQINAVNHGWLSEKYGVTDFLDPYQNVLCGISMVAQNHNNYQDVDKALMAYNMGATGAGRLWDKGIYETSYTRKVRDVMEVYGNEI